MYRSVKRALRAQADALVPAYDARVYAAFLPNRTEALPRRSVKKYFLPIAVGLAVVLLAAVLAPRLLNRRDVHLIASPDQTTSGSLAVNEGQGYNADTVSAGNETDPMYETTSGAETYIPPTEPPHSLSPGAETEIPSPKTTVTIPVAETHIDVATVPRWEDRPLTSRFAEVEYNGARYTLLSTEPASQPLDTRLSDGMAYGYDAYSDRQYTASVVSYSFRNMSSEWVIGVLFEDSDEVWAYANAAFVPATMGDMLAAADFENSVVIEGISKDVDQVLPLDPGLIWSELCFDRSLEPAGDEFDAGVADIIVSCPALGVVYKTITLTAKGCVEFNLMNTYYGSCRFFVGVDRVKQFLQKAGIAYDDREFDPARFDPPTDATVVSAYDPGT